MTLCIFFYDPVQGINPGALRFLFFLQRQDEQQRGDRAADRDDKGNMHAVGKAESAEDQGVDRSSDGTAQVLRNRHDRSALDTVALRDLQLRRNRESYTAAGVIEAADKHADPQQPNGAGRLQREDEHRGDDNAQNGDAGIDPSRVSGLADHAAVDRAHKQAGYGKQGGAQRRLGRAAPVPLSEDDHGLLGRAVAPACHAPCGGAGSRSAHGPACCHGSRQTHLQHADHRNHQRTVIFRGDMPPSCQTPESRGLDQANIRQRGHRGGGKRKGRADWSGTGQGHFCCATMGGRNKINFLLTNER